VYKSDTWEIRIACGEWSVTLFTVKPEWKRSQSVRDFVNGNADFLDNILPS
jgi:methionyl-tRNA formyltransferase